MSDDRNLMPPTTMPSPSGASMHARLVSWVQIHPARLSGHSWSRLSLPLLLLLLSCNRGSERTQFARTKPALGECGPVVDARRVYTDPNKSGVVYTGASRSTNYGRTWSDLYLGTHLLFEHGNGDPTQAVKRVYGYSTYWDDDRAGPGLRVLED